jgi:hypothetical protein
MLDADMQKHTFQHCEPYHSLSPLYDSDSGSDDSSPLSSLLGSARSLPFFFFFVCAIRNCDTWITEASV